MKFNLLDGKASTYFGANELLYYFKEGIFKAIMLWMPLLYFGLIKYIFDKSSKEMIHFEKYYICIAIFLINILIISFSPHKEDRYNIS